MTQHLIIDATLTTVGPMSIAMPVAQGGKANAWNNFPMIGRGLTDTGEVLQTAYLPASTVRGFLRREVAVAAMRARGAGQTTLQQAYADVLGQGSDTKEEADLQKMQALREQEPILDLFGSWSIKSRLLVSNFMPALNVLPQAITGTRKDLEDTDGVLEFLNEAERRAYHQRTDTNSHRATLESEAKKLARELNKAKKDGKPTADLEAAKAALDGRVEALKNTLGDMQNSTRTITEFYAMPAGLVLSGRLVVQQPKPRDLPMLEGALHQLSLRPLLGAQVARGCGEVAGRFTVLQDGQAIKVITVGGWRPAEVAELGSTVTV